MEKKWWNNVYVIHFRSVSFSNVMEVVLLHIPGNYAITFIDYSWTIVKLQLRLDYIARSFALV